MTLSEIALSFLSGPLKKPFLLRLSLSNKFALVADGDEVVFSSRLPHDRVPALTFDEPKLVGVRFVLLWHRTLPTVVGFSGHDLHPLGELEPLNEPGLGLTN